MSTRGASGAGLPPPQPSQIAAYPVAGRVEPRDLIATLFHCLGYAPDTELHDTEGRPHPISRGRVIDEILQSYTELIANPAAYQDADKRHAMHQVRTLLEGVLEARGKVLVKLNVGADDLDAVIALLPSMKAPTVSALHGAGGFAVETVVPKREINVLIPALKDAGAADIIELPLSKIVH